MNYRVMKAANGQPLAIVKTGAAAVDGEVFVDLKIARAVVVDMVEGAIRKQRTDREAALTAARKVALAEDEASFKAWRERRDAITTVREKDLSTEPAAPAEPAAAE